MAAGSLGVVRKSSKSARFDNVYAHLFTPRIYQISLLDVALRRNTVVCLGSQTAKTFLTVMLTKELAHQLHSDIGDKDKLKHTFVFFDSATSVESCACLLRLHTNLRVEECTLDSASGWRDALSRAQVIVTIPSAFLSAVASGSLSDSRINLVVFDDCHLSAEPDHPYNHIVDFLDQCQNGMAFPRVLGLTLSILANITAPSQLNQRLKAIEGALHSTAEMASDTVMADRYGIRPKESLVDCDAYVDSTGLLDELGCLLRSALDFIDDMSSGLKEGEDFRSTARLVLSETMRILMELGPWCAARVTAAFVTQLIKLEKPSAAVDIRQTLLHLSATVLRSVEKRVDVAFDRQVQTLEDFRTFISPRAGRLIDVIRDNKPDDSFVIISGDFEGDFDDSDGCLSDDDSLDDMSDSELPPPSSVADNKASGKTNSKKRQKSTTIEKSANSNGSGRYVAVRRAVNDSGAYAGDEEGLCGIVFVEHRHTAFALNKLIVELCNWDPDLYFVRSHYVAGAAGPSTSEAQRQKQEDVLRKFRQREINVLVATATLEEGVDLPRCNLVVRFDPPTSYRSYMQSKGRARGSNAKYCILVDHTGENDFSSDMDTFKGIENILLDRCRNEDDYSSEPINEAEVNLLLPPFCPSNEPGSPQVTMTTAIRLVNRYCAKLPSDAFTHLTPKCRIEPVLVAGDPSVTHYRATVQLPINSPIKRPIVGEAMPSRRLAQMAAALATCRVLHERGELDDRLQPIGKEIIKYDDDDCEWEDYELHGQPRPGTTKRKQYYIKKVATVFLGQPCPDTLCCLYAFTMKLTCPITEEQNTRGRPIHAPEDTPRGFGLLCKRTIPPVPQFPVFTRSGEVTVAVELVSSTITLSESELSRLHEFHRFVFCHVLRLEKSPMIYDPASARSSNIVVPIHCGESDNTVIDWAFVELIETSPLAISIRSAHALHSSANHRSNSNRNGVSNSNLKPVQRKEPFVFDEALFADAVVMPSYRNVDQPQYFYVAEIRHDLTPRSAFPSPELYDTFEHYYKCKYNLALTALTQPLLDVDHTSARLNLLTPRYVNQKGVALPTSSATTRRAKRENLQQKQILVPELCDVHPFPASLWRKAVCLPAILYRTNSLLIADELRTRIAVEAKIGGAGHMADSSVGSLPALKFEVPAPGLLQPDQDNSTGVNPEISNHSSVKCTKCSQQNNGLIISVECSCKIPGDHAAEDGSSSSTLQHLNGLLPNHKEEIYCRLNDSSKHGCPNVDHGQSTAGSTACSNGNGVDLNCVQGSPLDDKTVHNNRHSNAVVGENRAEISSVDVHGSAISSSATCSDSEMTNTIVVANGVSFVTNNRRSFSLDADTTARGGPSPCDIIQTLTMSNANDFFNLERLETIGDSFLKFAITIYLYCSYPGIHEGKLSYMRSVQVSNYNLYLLGKRKQLPECMVAVKFEPSENWLPPGYTIRHPENRLDSTRNASSTRDRPKAPDATASSATAATVLPSVMLAADAMRESSSVAASDQQRQFNRELEELSRAVEEEDEAVVPGADGSPIRSSSSSAALQTLLSSTPYSLQMQHSLPDKSIADCVEALIGCYLASCGRRAALRFMDWLGLHVFPPRPTSGDAGEETEASETDLGGLVPPASPLLRHVPDADRQLAFQLIGYESFEENIGYRFRDRSYLLQAFTHASYHYNVITDCYQRLEFLGDAILDYIITRHLFEDSTKHSPGVLTDLRSALVNNNIFACLAVQWNFHKYFKAISPQLFTIIEKFVLWQIDHDHRVILDDEMECAGENGDEDIEIPKALGDIFESVAGAIYLDSGMSLDTVWRVYYNMMKPHIDAFLEKIPKSPVRELLEMEPETAKFEKPERTINGKIRVSVNVVGKGNFSGVGRNYRIAKSAAAKRALRFIKAMLPMPADLSPFQGYAV